MAKLNKRTKKFVKNKLDQTIQQRRDAKKKLKYVQKKGKRGEEAQEPDEMDAASEPEAVANEGTAASRMGVDEFLRGGFREGMEEAEEDEDEEREGGDHYDDVEDDDDLDEVDDLEDEEAHAQDLAKLAETDPEFYKYLQENDQDLLHFGQDNGNDEEDEEEAEDASAKMNAGDGSEDESERILTMDMLRQWQKGLLRHRSPRALRRLLLAFRAALDSGESNGAGRGDEPSAKAYQVQDSRVFSKLIVTTLK